jgi:hypothetical protein
MVVPSLVATSAVKPTHLYAHPLEQARQRPAPLPRIRAPPRRSCRRRRRRWVRAGWRAVLGPPGRRRGLVRRQRGRRPGGPRRLEQLQHLGAV